MLPWVMILMVIVMKRDTASADITNVTRTSGESLKLSPDFRRGRMGTALEFRWTHSHLLLNNHITKCHHSRCKLLEDGSLSFSRVQPEDSGDYTLEVYNKHGVRQHKQVFRLQVEERSQSRTTAILCSLLLLLILLFLILSFVLRKRRFPRPRTSGAAGEREAQIYMEMRGDLANKNQDAGEKKEEEPIYVPCYSGVPAEAENIYV